MKVFLLLCVLPLFHAGNVKRAVCSDKIYGCDTFLEEMGGDACKNSAYVKDNCEATCGSCTYDDDASGCVDQLKQEYCDAIVEEGGCDPSHSLIRYATENCKKSCGICKIDLDVNTCDDRLSKTDCESLIGDGDCDAIMEYVKVNCENTCGLCKEYDDSNKYCVDTLQNDAYPKPGENCAALEETMPGFCDTPYADNCPRTCGKC